MSGDRPKLQEEHDEDVEQDGSTVDELSLEQLSKAYAQVLQQQNELEESQTSGDDSASDDDSGLEADDENSDETPRRSSSTTSISLEQIDSIDNAACPISPQSIVEAILFVGAPASVTLTGKKLAAVMRDVSPKEVKSTIKQLNKEYEESNTAFRIVEDSGNYKLQLCEELVDVQNYFFGRNKAAKLNQSAIDVLAIVAYHQPVTRAQVDNIRARPSASVLNQLLRRNLISFEAEQKSRDKTYNTTARFLQLFGLDSLKDLPQTSVVSDLEELTDF